jgi:hypothetical protein
MKGPEMTNLDRELIAITEQIADWRTDDLEVRLNERLISHVLLSGGTSKNGYRYAEAALREAAALYERKPVFLDHAANLAKPYDRSMRDLAGWVAEARYLNGCIVGQIQVLDTEAGRTLLALTSSPTPAVGMSHVILARKSADGTLVEKIHDVISVDAVVFPATTSGFREQAPLPAGGEAASESETARQEVERKLEELRSELEQLSTERDDWRRRCEEFEADAALREIDRQLAATGLSDELITSSLRERLRAAPDSAARSRLIAEHQQFVIRCRQRSPCSHPRRAPDADRDASVLRQIVQAVKKG